jgi:hypothetical protein
MKAPFESSSHNTHDAQRNVAFEPPNKVHGRHWSQRERLEITFCHGGVLFHHHTSGGKELKKIDLEDKYERELTGVKMKVVSISMDDRQRSPILDELSA